MLKKFRNKQGFQEYSVFSLLFLILHPKTHPTLELIPLSDRPKNMNRWQASIPTDKISLFSPASLTNLSLKLQFCMKKAAMKLSSLPLKMSVSYRNRTYNRVLGVRVTLVSTCQLMSINVSIYLESGHFPVKLYQYI